jgi:hypothetical protein
MADEVRHHARDLRLGGRAQGAAPALVLPRLLTGEVQEAIAPVSPRARTTHAHRFASRKRE